jgi:hypothetical protein
MKGKNKLWRPGLLSITDLANRWGVKQQVANHRINRKSPPFPAPVTPPGRWGRLWAETDVVEWEAQAQAQVKGGS